MRNRIILLAVVIMISIAGIALNPPSSTATALVVSAMPRATPQKPLNEEEVGAMLDELEEGLPELVNDEDAVAAIKEKWEARQDLVGNTPLQIIRYLYADVRSVKDDKETLAALWKAWWNKFGTPPPVVKSVPLPARTVPETTRPPTADPSNGTVANTAPGSPCPNLFVHDRYPMRAWLSAAASADGSKLIAAAGSYKGLNFDVHGFSNEGDVGIEQWYKQLVVGTDNLYTSSDAGGTWVARESPRKWIAVASSADGSRLIAAEVGGRLYTSTDSGVTWTPRESNRLWIAVSSSADGKKLAAAAMAGQIYISNDAGATWIPRATAGYWRSIASSADGTTLVAATSMFNGMTIQCLKGFIYVSTDSGVTWTPRYQAGNWFSVATSADGRKMVAAQYLVTGSCDDIEPVAGIYRSTDGGVTWANLNVSLGGKKIEYNPWFSVATSADGTKIVAVDQKYYGTQEFSDRGDAGYGALWTSSDSGKTWVIQAVPDMNKRWTAAAISGDGNVIIGLIYNSDHWISRDGGVRWLKGGNDGSEWREVAVSSDGKKMMAIVVGEGPIIASSDSGVTWAGVGPTRRWEDISVSADGSRLAATAYVINCPKRNDDGSYGDHDDPGEILTSANSGSGWTSRSKSKSWSLVSSSSDGKVLAAAHSVTLRMANGHIRGNRTSQIFTSNDYGATWTPHETAQYWTGLAVSSDGSRMAAVGKNTQIYVSADSGETWTPHENTREWVAIASSADGAKLVAAAISGRIYTSADYGATWTARMTDQHWRGVASSADGTKLVAAEKGGYLYTSWDSGATWAKRAFKTEWVTVACSGDGSKMIAASDAGELVISTNFGATWNMQEGE
jgi:hypothetical protein